MVVESPYTWYWLVEGLLAAGYRVPLANPTASEPYQGLQHPEDQSEARGLAPLRRVGILPAGYLYPKEERAIGDLLRKRSQLVRQRPAKLLSLQKLLTRNPGSARSGKRIKQLTGEGVAQLLAHAELAVAGKSNLAGLQGLEEQIAQREEVVLAPRKLRAGVQPLRTVRGSGPMLGLTLMWEPGESDRFATGGDFAS